MVPFLFSLYGRPWPWTDRSHLVICGKMVARGYWHSFCVKVRKVSTSLGTHVRSCLFWVMSYKATAIDPLTAPRLVAGRSLKTHWIPCPKMRVALPFHDHDFCWLLNFSVYFSPRRLRWRLRKPVRAAGSSQPGWFGFFGLSTVMVPCSGSCFPLFCLYDLVMRLWEV